MSSCAHGWNPLIAQIPLPSYVRPAFLVGVIREATVPFSELASEKLRGRKKPENHGTLHVLHFSDFCHVQPPSPALLFIFGRVLGLPGLDYTSQNIPFFMLASILAKQKCFSKSSFSGDSFVVLLEKSDCSAAILAWAKSPRTPDLHLDERGHGQSQMRHKKRGVGTI